MIKWVCWAVGVGLLLTGCYGPGTYGVSSQPQNGKIGVGLWHTSGTSKGSVRCYWMRRDRNGTPLGAGFSQQGPRYVQIGPADATFQTEGCEKWVQADGPFDKAVGGQVLTDGDYRVGKDIQPGVYTIPASDSCIWQRVSGWGSAGWEAIDYGPAVRSPIVVLSTDIGLRLENCGTVYREDTWIM